MSAAAQLAAGLSDMDEIERMLAQYDESGDKAYTAGLLLASFNARFAEKSAGFFSFSFSLLVLLLRFLVLTWCKLGFRSGDSQVARSVSNAQIACEQRRRQECGQHAKLGRSESVGVHLLLFLLLLLLNRQRCASLLTRTPRKGA